jgi:RNA polymerase sigma-70 factor (ECF subfamily)
MGRARLPHDTGRGTSSGAIGSAGASPEDLELVDRLLQGDEAAFEALVAQYHGSLLRLARIFVADGEVAEEVVQDTWMAVMHGLSRFERRSSLKTWLFAILTNRARTRAVREKRSVPFSALDTVESSGELAVEPGRFTADGMWAMPPTKWGGDNPEARMLREETMAILRNALSDLPSRQRLVVTLRDVEGLDSEEVCNLLQISETNQRVLLHRGRSGLRAVLERHLNGKALYADVPGTDRPRDRLEEEAVSSRSHRETARRRECSRATPNLYARASPTARRPAAAVTLDPPLWTG